MSKELKDIHNDIHKTLEKQTEIMQKMLEKMPEQNNRFITMLQTVVLIIGALGFINLIDVIIKWVGG